MILLRRSRRTGVLFALDISITPRELADWESDREMTEATWRRLSAKEYEFVAKTVALKPKRPLESA